MKSDSAVAAKIKLVLGLHSSEHFLFHETPLNTWHQRFWVQDSGFKSLVCFFLQRNQQRIA